MADREGDKPESDALLSIGATVERLRPAFPEVSQSSLRFLEREGLIHSSRTAGGHRLYSDADILRISLIKTWQREGSSLDQVRERLALRDSLSNPALLSTQFLHLVEDDRLEEARKLVLDADRAGVSPATLFLEVLQPVLIRVGEDWASGAVAVYEEKAISEVCRELIAEISARHAPQFSDGPLLITACVEDERHELGLRMINGLLRQQGYRVRYLGADVSTAFLLDAVASYQPDAVLLSCGGDWSVDDCLEAVAGVKSLSSDSFHPEIIVGGRAIEHASKQVEELGARPFPAGGSMAALLTLIPTGT